MTENDNSSFLVGDLLVDPSLDQISRMSKIGYLRPQVMEILGFLASRNGDVVSTQVFLRKLWAGKVVTDGTVYNCIAELRQAISKLDDSQSYIETIPKKGYRLSATVKKQRTPPPSPAADGKSALPNDWREVLSHRVILRWALPLFLLASLIIVILPHEIGHAVKLRLQTTSVFDVR